ncbi:hypothetical protein F8M41_013229 [Gigaspora margarita]|uniref:Uncharacterized protein n=1 Tax=Gigaspora margarita TaxID=4874 RepID=A0A8H4A0K4_GIGMA|nr:hypothetical protein F8M41_013229 [Gigaspora margarita]
MFGVLFESLTEKFIMDYGKYDKMKWFRNLQKLLDTEFVSKIARVFDNTDASHSAKKSSLKSDKAKLGLLNSVIFTTYGLKFKATDRHLRYYCLVGPFDSEYAPELLVYQTSKGPFYKNDQDIQYRYSKLLLDELETSSNSIT